MPHGYQCDRCETFVEQRMREMYEIDGRDVEAVSTALKDIDGELSVHKWTLCEGCRKVLVMLVEEGVDLDFPNKPNPHHPARP